MKVRPVEVQPGITKHLCGDHYGQWARVSNVFGLDSDAGQYGDGECDYCKAGAQRMANWRSWLTGIEQTNGHDMGPLREAGGPGHTGVYSSSCRGCGQQIVAGPHLTDFEGPAEKAKCPAGEVGAAVDEALHPALKRLFAGKVGALQCVVPGCNGKATHAVSWFYRKNRRSEVVQMCAKHSEGAMNAAYANPNFRTPACTRISPQRAKALDTHALLIEGGFDRFSDGVDSMFQRAVAQGHAPKVAWAKNILDNALHSDEQHTLRCQHCGASDQIKKNKTTNQWEVTHGDLTNAACEKGKVMATRKVAHDSGDGETIYHCPFCGSGQVSARSDRTIECDFCHTCFTVQVQPELPAFPQTINGMPVAVPGMPGQIGEDGDPMDSNMGAGVPGDIDADADGDAGDDMMSPDDLSDDEGDDAQPDGSETTDEGDEMAQPPAGGGGFSGKPSADNQPPWLKGNPSKKSFRTASGAELTEDAYVRHLALKHADDRARALEAVREAHRP